MKLKVLMILVIIISCKEQCPSELNLGNFKLSKKSLNSFPYQNNEKQLIFKDSLGNKVIYMITKPHTHKEKIKRKEICLSSKDKKRIIKATNELHEVNLKTNSDSFQSIKIELTTDFYFNKARELKEYDCMWFYRGGGGTPKMITDIKNSNSTYLFKKNYKEQIIINGNQYKNIIEIKSGNINSFYYDLEKGIIAINEYRDYRKPKYWILDSVIYKK
ncbi:hypothetical protein [Tenacibaculum ovolyticum]|uniref:hypothetical protein n=1 Tax=Tenacibaculum ovolyticum TaxID=104270 RepID=UPI00040AF766|nr:hypothetical protein [Tenacibaculum ovolyticum]